MFLQPKSNQQKEPGRFAYIIEWLQRGVRRFPAPLIVALAACVSFIISFATNGETALVWLHIGEAASATLPWFIAASLLTEALEGQLLKRLAVAWGPILATVGFLAWLQYMQASVETVSYGTIQVPITTGLVFAIGLLAIFLAPFPRLKKLGGFWMFGYGIIRACLFTGLAAGILNAGIFGALFAIKALFDVEIPTQVWKDVGIFIQTILLTCVFLASLPRAVDSETEQALLPTWIRLGVLYVLCPLLVIYLAILTLYAGRILFTWTLPSDTVVAWILVYGVLTVAIAVLTYPLRLQEKLGRPFRIIHSVSFIALAPLLALYAISIYTRVSAYGFTVNRVAIVLAGLWLAFWTTYTLVRLRRQESLAVLPLSLIVVILLSLFGPLSAYDVAFRSQLSIVRNTLASMGALENGTPKPMTPSADQTYDRRTVTDALDYLFRTYQSDRVLSVLWPENINLRTDVDAAPYSGGLVVSRALFGIEQLDISPSNYVYLTRNETFISVRDYDVVNALKEWDYATISIGNGYSIKTDSDHIVHVLQNQPSGQPRDVLALDISNKMVAWKQERKNLSHTSSVPTNDLTLDAENAQLRLRVILDHVQLNTRPGSTTQVGSPTGWILVGFKNKAQ